MKLALNILKLWMGVWMQLHVSPWTASQWKPLGSTRFSSFFCRFGSFFAGTFLRLQTPINFLEFNFPVKELPCKCSLALSAYIITLQTDISIWKPSKPLLVGKIWLQCGQTPDEQLATPLTQNIKTVSQTGMWPLTVTLHRTPLIPHYSLYLRLTQYNVVQ